MCVQELVDFKARKIVPVLDGSLFPGELQKDSKDSGLWIIINRCVKVVCLKKSKQKHSPVIMKGKQDKNQNQ